ncbi:hypothetical protein FHW69_003308, partial [Luteibacter sp. Sphag1AF]|uniref:phospholipase effector Tle1 domain-containing protein n=1 Tax=Luteibacter sp. Sphag1AF TaxID=2587031 RepID=UPI001616F971
MTEKHRRDEHGYLQDGVSTYPASATDMRFFQGAADILNTLPVPTLYRTTDPQTRLFVAAFDGTGNDVDGDPEHATNVALLRRSIRAMEQSTSRVHVEYLKGPGTQKNAIIRMVDGAFGYTYDDRLEDMYKKFISYAAVWLDEDPNAQIRIIETGFSRGADQAAGFARMVHERGIQDPDGYERSGSLIGPDEISFNRPPLVAPGNIPQAVALF